MDPRDPDRHRAQVLPFRHPPAGGLAERPAVILSIGHAGGRRVSKVRGATARPSPSPFRPGASMPTRGDRTGPGPGSARTLAGGRVPDAPLDELASRIGLRLTPAPPAERSER